MIDDQQCNRNKSQAARLLLSAIAANIVGFFAMTGLPFFFEAAQEFRNLSPRVTGFILSTLLFSTAITSICISPFMGKLSCRKVAFKGALLASVCYFICPFLNSKLVVWGCILGGIGSGCALSASHTAIARFKNAEQNFAYLIFGTGIVTAFLVTFLKYFIVLVGSRSGIVAACLCFPLAFIILLMPENKNEPSAQNPKIPSLAVPWILGSLAILVLMLKSLGGKVLWTSTEYFAVMAGYTEAKIGVVMGITGLGGLIGSVFAIGLKNKIGRTIPLLCGMLFTIAMISVMQFSGTKVGFFIGRLGWSLGGSFILPYVFGAMAVLDPRGRINAAASGFGTISGAMGPVIVGCFRQTDNNEFFLSIFVLCCFILSAICAVFVAVNIDNREKISAANV